MENKNLEMVPFEGFLDPRGKRHVYVCDMNTDESRWSTGAVEYFGLPGEYMIDAANIWLEHIHPEDRAAYLEDISSVFSGKKDYHNIDYRARNKDGEYVMCTCRGRVVPSFYGDGKIFMGTIENHGISSMFDSVTGLNNVYSFLSDANIYRRSVDIDVLLMVGINFFSDINKSYGYEVGNRILKMFAEKLRGLADKPYKAYRMDGAKFCIAVKNGRVEDAEIIYNRIREIAHAGFDIGGIHVSFTVSGGAVVVDDKNITEYALQASLGYVVERSKRYKHGELVVFDNGSRNEAGKQLRIMEAIRNSVFNSMENYYLCYQPIIDANNDKICGAETLLRWHSEEMGEVPPGIFIPWLENDPCFYELGCWVMENALIDMKPFVEDNPDFIVNVNVSAEQIERSGFRNSICSILEKVGFPPQNLCMELTERVMSLDLKFLRGELEFFKNMGIKIALDDFGTGVSSLNLLLELEVDCLKIDRNFVKDITTSKSEQCLVQTIARCAENMHLDLCVEGVETVEMKEFLGNYQIPKHQGYLYSKPVRLEVFKKLM